MDSTTYWLLMMLTGAVCGRTLGLKRKWEERHESEGLQEVLEGIMVAVKKDIDSGGHN